MIGDRRVLAIVPARGGSQRLIAKNVRPLAGRPMVAWTLEAARGSALIDHLVVSTDDPAVAAIAAELGWPPPFMRPDHLSGATSPVIDAIEHALEQVGGRWDYVVVLQPTSPLRTAADIDGAVRLCDDTGAPAVIGVSPLPKPPVFYGQVDAEGRYTPGGVDFERAALINGAVYVGRPDVLMRDRTFQSAGALAYPMPFERSWDVDTLAEFAVCEALFPFQG
ncbi:MAG: acylneuraminate cytidylyltransferase family protein [Brevundimonas sp.]|uniref:acylneuraminate cytidylyltransferase family protein n=1 Tax=Brevundimonas sp. TaxID=1871086 RepID=UPI00260C1817|nr:acylneuraminate cytidylyltransferase family protein [Brevundimonas sp.]MDI6624724.1 acylneuraminate cytidylyltransferase family protein [Brevundimonas sp.]MDQ7812752.1 acylneuraminate cytidylyltransferase family protein [Brevundimonas sp.]